MGLHDRYSDDGIRIADQFPSIDFVKYHAILHWHDASGILFILEVNDGNAFVSQLLIAALGNGQLCVSTCSGGFCNNRHAAHSLHSLIDCKADFPPSDAAGETVRGAGHQIRLDDDLIAGLDNILQTADLFNYLINCLLDGFVALILRFHYSNF